MSNSTFEATMSFDDLVESLCDEAKIDFISAWKVALEVSYMIKSVEPDAVMKVSILVMRALIARDILPGDYTLESLERDGFQFWPGTPDELIRRIEDAWTALKRMPDVDDICWFALKKPAKA